MSFEIRDLRGRLKRLDVPVIPAWKALTKARAEYERALEKLRLEGIAHEKLRGDLAQAQEADLRRLGTALAADKTPPAETAPKVEAELDKARRRFAALEYEVERLALVVIDVVERNRPAWVADARLEDADAAQDYLRAIDALEQARLRHSERLAVTAWITSWPEMRGTLRAGTLGVLRTLKGVNGDPMPLEPVLAALRAELDPPAAKPAARTEGSLLASVA